MTNFQFIDLPDIRLRAAVEGSGPLVVMVHGFPESWFSWRHQMAPIAAGRVHGLRHRCARLWRIGQAQSGRGLRHGAHDRRCLRA